MVHPLDPRTARSEVQVEVPVDRVWRALTTATDLERWFPRAATIEPGESGRYRFEWGEAGCHVWEIAEWEPLRHLRLVDAAVPGQPRLVTDLHLRGGAERTHLRVVTSSFPEERDWDDLIHGTTVAYRFLLLQLRHYLERHDGEDRRILSLHRRLSSGREEAWDRLAEADLPGLDGGEMLDREEGWQIAAVLSEPAGAVVRLALDPLPGEDAGVDVALWLSAWGLSREAMERAEGRWRDALTRLFPPDRQTEATGGSASPPDGETDRFPAVYVGYNMTGPAAGQRVDRR